MTCLMKLMPSGRVRTDFRLVQAILLDDRLVGDRPGTLSLPVSYLTGQCRLLQLPLGTSNKMHEKNEFLTSATFSYRFKCVCVWWTTHVSSVIPVRCNVICTPMHCVRVWLNEKKKKGLVKIFNYHGNRGDGPYSSWISAVSMQTANVPWVCITPPYTCFSIYTAPVQPAAQLQSTLTLQLTA